MSSYGAYPTSSPGPGTPGYGAPGYGAPVVGVDPTAVMGRRIGAYFIDSAIILILAIAVFAALFAAAKPYTEKTGLDDASSYCSNNYNDTDAPNSGKLCFNFGDDTAYILDGGQVGAVYGYGAAGSAIGWLLDLIVLQGLTGASVGKFLVGLRVVREDGRTCGLGRAFVRTLLLIVDSFFCALVGLICAFSSKGHRRVGDMAAGTLVVPRAQVGTPVAVPGYTTAASGSAAPYGSYPAPGAGTAAWPPATSSSPEQAGWAQPAAGPAPSSSTPSGDGPHWDEARGAYITYDRSRGTWLEYDQAAGTWGPISQ